MNAELIKDTIVINTGQFVYLYSLTRKLAAKVDAETYKKEKLEGHGFFNDITFPPIRSEVGSLFLLLTRDCPLACRYCYAEAGIKKESMPVTIAEEAIKAYLALDPPKPSIRFGGGGEPTLEQDLIQRIIEKFGDTKIIWTLITSGVMSERFLRWLIEKRVSITFSLDGPPEIQDLHRPLKSGKGSSDIAEMSVRIYRKYRGKLAIRCTLSKISFVNLDKMLRYFKDIGVTTLSVEPLYPMGRGVNSPFIPSPEETLEMLIRILEWGRLNGVIIRTSALLFPRLTSPLVFCEPIEGTSLVVNHKGYLVACGEALDSESIFWNKWVIGELKDGKFVIDKNKLAKLTLSSSVENIKECSSCFARYICRGGCPMRRLWFTGDLARPSPHHCFVAKHLLISVVMRAVDGEYKLPISFLTNSSINDPNSEEMDRAVEGN
jgi:uncharacterized protein